MNFAQSPRNNSNRRMTNSNRMNYNNLAPNYQNFVQRRIYYNQNQNTADTEEILMQLEQFVDPSVDATSAILQLQRFVSNLMNKTTQCSDDVLVTKNKMVNCLNFIRNVQTRVQKVEKGRSQRQLVLLDEVNDHTEKTLRMVNNQTQLINRQTEHFLHELNTKSLNLQSKINKQKFQILDVMNSKIDGYLKGNIFNVRMEQDKNQAQKFLEYLFDKQKNHSKIQITHDCQLWFKNKINFEKEIFILAKVCQNHSKPLTFFTKCIQQYFDSTNKLTMDSLEKSQLNKNEKTTQFKMFTALQKTFNFFNQNFTYQYKQLFKSQICNSNYKQPNIQIFKEMGEKSVSFKKLLYKMRQLFFTQKSQEKYQFPIQEMALLKKYQYVGYVIKQQQLKTIEQNQNNCGLKYAISIFLQFVNKLNQSKVRKIDISKIFALFQLDPNDKTIQQLRKIIDTKHKKHLEQIKNHKK